jgi:hypothetical protein
MTQGTCRKSLQGNNIAWYPLVFGRKGAIIAARDISATPEPHKSASRPPQSRAGIHPRFNPNRKRAWPS